MRPRRAGGRKAVLVVTDLGLAVYWILTAFGVVSVGDSAILLAWNWSFLPLDLLAIVAGLASSLLSERHFWGASSYVVALVLTHVAGLMAVSFFALWGTWDASWWAVNLWLMLMPLGLGWRLVCESLRSRHGCDGFSEHPPR